MKHTAPFLVIMWITIKAEDQACSLTECETGTHLCVAESGLGKDCSGFRGCNKVCPPGSSSLLSSSSKQRNHFYLVKRYKCISQMF